MVGNIVSVQTCSLKGFCLGTLVNRIVFLFGSPGKNYTTVPFPGEKWGEWNLFLGRLSLFDVLLRWCFFSSNCIGYKLSQTTVRFSFPTSFWHSFLKCLLNPNATVESLNWYLSKIMKMVYALKMYNLSSSFYSQFK